MNYVFFLSLFCAALSIALIAVLIKYSNAKNTIQQNISQYEELSLKYDGLKSIIQDAERQKMTELKELEQQNNALKVERATLMEKVANLHASNNELKQATTSNVTQVENVARIVANNLLEKTRKEAMESSSNVIGNLFNPIKNDFAALRKEVMDAHSKELEGRNNLQGELKSMFAITQQMHGETKKIASVLSGDAKARGNWGELVLQRLLEKSGLEKSMYELQSKNSDLFNSDGGKAIPDAIIYLPENKCVIVDAKVSLLSYERYRDAENEEDRLRFRADFLSAVRAQMTDLRQKKYHQSEGLKDKSLGLVIMFMPIESAYLEAMQDWDLFNEAWKSKVIIVGPTNFILALHLIATQWKQETSQRRAEEVVDIAGRIYEKAIGFLESVGKWGDCLDRARDSFDEAVKKMRDGKGNLLQQIGKIKQVGKIESTKEAPSQFLPDLNIDDEE